MPTKAPPKCPTGIRGLDEITNGGLPRGRTTLVCGGTGTGKTILGMEFLVRGAHDHGERGVFVAFEEQASDVAANTHSLGFDVRSLITRKELLIVTIGANRTTTPETGEFNLDGLFLRLGAEIDHVGAKRVVLDTLDILFSAISNTLILRSELQRLFRWLKGKGVTAIVTGEAGTAELSRNGLEEFVSDCVILLQQRVVADMSTRRLRIVKYRGSAHGFHDYPFTIGAGGIALLPITSIHLNYHAPKTFVSTGVPDLDRLVGGKGYYRAATVLISGGAGGGKTSLASHAVEAACRRGERTAFFAFEESPSQIIRNMGSIGIDLGKWVERGLLKFLAARPQSVGLDYYLGAMVDLADTHHPTLVAIDPMSALNCVGTQSDARGLIMRIINILKSRKITGIFTSLTNDGERSAEIEAGITSLIDTWILVRNLEQNGERTRGLTVLKARGVKHSNQIREMILTNRGVTFAPIYVGPEGVLTGSARAAQDVLDKAANQAARKHAQLRKAVLTAKRKAIAAKTIEMESEYAIVAEENARSVAENTAAQMRVLARRGNQSTEQERAGAKK